MQQVNNTDSSAGETSVIAGNIRVVQPELNRNDFTVIRNSENCRLDLGGYGKGYAVDSVVEILKDWEIDSAMIHGGRSSVFAFGTPPGEKGWRLKLRHPSRYKHVIADLLLADQAVNGSGIQKGSHIFNPRTGLTVTDRIAAWAFSTTAADGDALSTAFMVMTPEEIKQFSAKRRDVSAIIITTRAGDKPEILTFGRADFSPDSKNE